MITTVIHGTPLRETWRITAGAWPRWAMPYIIRPAPKMSLLIAESAAVITTMLSTVAAGPIPRAWKICTNGLPSEPMLCQGLIAMITARVST
ncbi:Uncharacterised protein [Mycobacteroides abscessus subsp. abscessus]|nr:Uncharacterised protein [Mycobacteroides abscessus subsp. abscessus]